MKNLFFKPLLGIRNVNIIFIYDSRDNTLRN